MMLFFLIAALEPSAHGDDLMVRARATKERIVTSESESRDLLDQLYSIQKKVKEIAKSRARLTEMMLSSDGDAKTLAQSLSMLQQRLAEQKARLSQRLSLLYRWNSPSLLPFLFSSASAGEFDRSLKYMRILSERDFDHLRNYERTLRAVHLQRSKLRAKVHVLLSLKKQIEQEEAKMASVFDEKKGLLDSLKSEKEAGIRALKKIRELHPELGAMLRAGFYEKRGSLPSPVAGRLESGFGASVDHDYWFRLLKKGWTYRTTVDSVRSIFSGEVAFAGLLPGYGPTVLIDHGDHYYSVYGWINHLKVQAGEEVTEGQLIGRASPRLYFEIRHFSDPIDPSQWIKDDNNKKKGI